MHLPECVTASSSGPPAMSASRSLRHVIEHPDLDLVGVWVHGQDKVNKDAGELAGVGPTGVMATNSIDDVLALKPDCVLYMPHVCN